MLDTDRFADEIPGEYQIKRLLGQSELGSAYLAYQPAQGRQVMITTFKLPRRVVAQHYEKLRQHLRRKEEILTRLAHPHLMPVYSFGMQPRYLYLVTAFVKEPSLGQLLKQNVRFTPEQTLDILKQLVAGLEYAHSQGIAHGMLSLSNVMVSSELQMRIAGFGLHTMLELHRNTQKDVPLSHLTSEGGTFLGNPEYISPERVMGLAADARADIYALGVMLFELLSGQQPFTGANALETALQRLQQPTPSLHAVCPEVPPAFDLLLGNMLERDPAKRIQYVGEIILTFERILRTLHPEKWAAPQSEAQPGVHSDVTLPPTVNWFDEPIPVFHQEETEMPARLPGSLAQEQVFPSEAVSGQAAYDAHSLGGIDPFDWWTSASAKQQAVSPPSPKPGTFAARPSTSRLSSPSQPVNQKRRKLVKSLVISTAAAGTLTVGGISFAHFIQSMKQSQANGLTTTGNTPTNGGTPGTQQTPKGQVKATPKTQQKQPTPQKQQPTPTAVPKHTGTVIGSVNQPVNTAVTFMNPATGVSSLLIRLANGNFEACERTCTHEPSPANLVNYIAGNQILRCPTHGAIFSTKNNFSHTSGPGGGALKSIAIRVNADGTVTTG